MLAYRITACPTTDVGPNGDGFHRAVPGRGEECDCVFAEVFIFSLRRRYFGYANAVVRNLLFVVFFFPPNMSRCGCSKRRNTTLLFLVVEIGAIPCDTDTKKMKKN